MDSPIPQTMDYIFAAWFFSVFVESMLSYFTQPILTNRDYLRYVSAVIGIGIALGFSIDLIVTLAGIASPYPWLSSLGTIMTGIAIGRGSNYIADIVSFL